MARDTQRTEVVIGPLPIRADSAEMATFAGALGLPSGTVPLTFPIRWLALPPVRQAIEDLIGLEPVHVSQTFDFDAPLTPDRDYMLTATLQAQRVPSPRLVVRSTVSNREGQTALRMETVLLPTAAITKTSPSRAEAGAGELPDIAVGPVEQAQAERYAAAAHDDGRLHADAAFARSVGLDGPIIHGMLLMGLFQKPLSEWRVASQVVRLFALFTRPVPAGSSLVIGGRLVAPAGDNTRQIVRLFVRNEQSELACIGEATLVPASARPA